MISRSRHVLGQFLEEQQAMKRAQGGEWVRDRQQLRNSTREARWCLEDGGRTRLPVLDGAKATELILELAGGHLIVFILLSAAHRCPLVFHVLWSSRPKHFAAASMFVTL